MKRAAWVLVAICLIIPAFVILADPGSVPAVFLTELPPILILFTVIVAMQALRFFSDEKRSGGLEILLSTPLTTREIIQGQWMALEHTFIAPLAVLTVFQIIGVLSIPWSATSSVVSTVVYFTNGWETLPVLFHIHLVAIVWLAMWLGAILKKPQHALPLVILGLLAQIPLRFLCCPALPIDLIVIFLARNRLYAVLRPKPYQFEVVHHPPPFLPPSIPPPLPPSRR